MNKTETLVGRFLYAQSIAYQPWPPFARCTRVLRKFDSCPGEKSLTSLSTMQNSSTVSRHCNTREPSWAEDFIDLTEFCQPSIVPIKMEDSVDECITSPINNTVRNHGFDYTLEVNDLDNNLDDTLWRMPSPALAMQEELCDPISDWLAATKETNNNNHNLNNNDDNNNNHHHHHQGSSIGNRDNLSSGSEISYNISDALLNSRLTSIPNSSHQYGKKTTSVNFGGCELQPESTASFFQAEAAFNEATNHSAAALTENLMLSRPETSIRMPSVSPLYLEKRRESTATTTAAYSTLPSRNQFLAVKDVSPLNRTPTVGLDVASASCTVQTTSNLSQEGKPAMSGMQIRRNTKLKLDMHDSASSCATSMTTPDMENSDFDLVSYVFEENNKPSVSLDVSCLQQSSRSASSTDVGSNKLPSLVTIKNEPKEEANEEQCNVGRIHSYGKHRNDKDEEEYRAKRLRRYSNCSSEDLTQLESEKYRELRNKNNEASRRSRANRKNREVEMREHALKLEAENRRLKVKAEEMEKLVKRLRNCLMQLVLKRR